MAEEERNDIHIAPVFEISSIEREHISEMTVSVKERELSVPYHTAQFPIPAQREPHLLSDSEMAEIITKIVDIEGPIHENEIITRVRNLWNLGRAGARIQKKVIASIKFALKQQQVKCEEGFYLSEQTVVKPRDRHHVDAPGVRKPEMLPPQEIRKAIVAIIEANFGAERDNLPTEVARLLGFQATSSALREVIEAQIMHLITENQLNQTENQLNLQAA